MSNLPMVSPDVWASTKTKISTRLSVDFSIKDNMNGEIPLKGEYAFASFWFFQHLIRETECLQPYIPLVRCQYEKRNPYQTNNIELWLKLFTKLMLPLPLTPEKKEEVYEIEGGVLLATLSLYDQSIVEAEKDIFTCVEEEAKLVSRRLAGQIEQSAWRIRNHVSEAQRLCKNASTLARSK